MLVLTRDPVAERIGSVVVAALTRTRRGLISELDLTTTDESGQTTHSIAVYLQRGRALLGVYFSQADGAQAAVAGQTTIPGIVGVFAARLAALPVSVVGS